MNTLESPSRHFPSLNGLFEFLQEAISENPPALLQDGGVIADGFDAELDQHRAFAKGGKTELSAILEREIRETGINSLKIKFTQVFGYFFEVPVSQAKNLPDRFIRRQTLANAERFTTLELKEFETKILSAEQKERERESQLFTEVLESAQNSLSLLQKTAERVSETDVVWSFAKTAKKYRLTRPALSKDGSLVVRGGRHPVVEVFLQNNPKGDRFVPNALEMNERSCFHLITGPNMAGKSTFLRQNALIVYLAHLGSFVPAEAAIIPLVDRIFTRIGSGDSLITGESTFLVEMQEAANILQNATEKSFVILDEIGRGTSTFDGLSIAWAITEYLHKKGVKTLFATHYHELIALCNELPFANNFSVAVLENEHGVTFLHRIQEGGAEKSFGIEVARLAGIPASVVKRSEKILSELESFEGKSAQASLFSAPVETKEIFHSPVSSETEDALCALDLQNMTPIQALSELAKLQEHLLKKE